ncbi:hypothetical protein LMIY3S_01859 [Labrys miyagiensis]
MSDFYHAIVWLDHREARIIHFGREGMEEQVIHPKDPPHQIHHKAGSIGAGKSQDDKDFLAETVKAVGDAGAVVITGPADAKHQLAGYIDQHVPSLASRIAAVETLDHPTDRELLAIARKHFRTDHQVLPRSH